MKKTNKPLVKKKPSSKGKCPQCGEVLSRFNVFNVDLNQCPKCHGLWFDALELETVKDAMDDDIRWKDFNLMAYAERAHFKSTNLRCPVCSSALCELRFDTTHILLEFCTKCHGVWMDKGKLFMILNHLRKQVALEPLEKIEKEAMHQFLEIFIGHKGPWHEIQDFAAAWRLLSIRFLIDHPTLAARLETARRALPF
jgi:Zn-finger nucleic acid-binding protein